VARKTVQKADETILENSKTVSDFLNQFTSTTTKRAYANHLRKFFSVIRAKPDEYVVDIRLLENDEKIKATDRYEKDIIKYRNHIIEKENFAPKSTYAYVNCVKLFLENNRIELSKAFWKNLIHRGGGSSTICEFSIPTPSDLKKILTHASTQARAMFLLQSSSGMRINEVVKLKIADIDMNQTHPHITIRYGSSKNRKPGRTRMSPEAKETIKEWLKVRKSAFEAAQKRTDKIYRKSDDGRLFPTTTKSARRLWNRLLEKSGFNEKDSSTKYNRYKMGVHSLRKYFRSQFSKYNNDLAKYLMNQRDILDKTYREWSDDYLDEHYAKGVNHLLVYGSRSEDITKINEQLNEKEERIKKLEERVQYLSDELGLRVLKELKEFEQQKEE